MILESLLRLFIYINGSLECAQRERQAKNFGATIPRLGLTIKC